MTRDFTSEGINNLFWRIYMQVKIPNKPGALSLTQNKKRTPAGNVADSEIY